MIKNIKNKNRILISMLFVGLLVLPLGSLQAAHGQSQGGDRARTQDARRASWSDLVNEYFAGQNSTSTQSDTNQNRNHRATSTPILIVATSTKATSTPPVKNATSTATSTTVTASTTASSTVPATTQPKNDSANRVEIAGLQTVAKVMDKLFPLSSPYDSTSLSAPATWTLSTVALITAVMGALLASGKTTALTTGVMSFINPRQRRPGVGPEKANVAN